MKTCVECNSLRNSSGNKYCIITMLLIEDIMIVPDFCIKKLNFIDLKKLIINNKLCLKKLSFNYKEACVEADMDCNICRTLLKESDII
jgi:hypothetical protein